MPRPARLFSLPLFDLARLAEAAAATAGAEVALRTLSPRRCLALVAGPHPRPRDVRADPTRLAWLVEVADRRVPGRPTCLRRALALSWLLRRRGRMPVLRIGVARDGLSLAAHAWVEVDGVAAYGAAPAGRYETLPLPVAPRTNRDKTSKTRLLGGA